MSHLESFIVLPDQVNGGQLSISGKELDHLRKVKRKQVGDEFSVTDGMGNFYSVRLQKLGRNEAICQILRTRRKVGEPSVHITLVQGILRSQRMDWLVEKGTELGVSRFVPAKTRYCNADLSEIKLKRWARIARAAVKQCGRSVFPEIVPAQDLGTLLLHMKKPIWFAHPGKKHEALASRQPSRVRHEQGTAVTLIVGPEGGFSEDEVDSMVDRRCEMISLGERRLRSETAAISMILLALREWGEV